MSIYTDINNWINNVYLLETTDPVLGGVGGISNKATKELADRTFALRTAMEDNGIYLDSTTFEGKSVITGASFSGVANGDIVYRNADTSFYQAQAGTSPIQDYVGIADVTSSKVIVSGLVSTSLTGHAAGTWLYLSSSTPGQFSITVNEVPVARYLYDGIIMLTGNPIPVVPTLPSNTDDSRIATTAFVQSVSLSATIPGADDPTNAGLFLTTDGTTPGWAEVAGGGASVLTDLTDVSSATPTSGNMLVANGASFASTALSSSTTSTSTITPASVSGVKSAYDIGNHAHPYAASSHNHLTTTAGYDIGAYNYFIPVLPDPTAALVFGAIYAGSQLISASFEVDIAYSPWFTRFWNTGVIPPGSWRLLSYGMQVNVVAGSLLSLGFYQRVS